MENNAKKQRGKAENVVTMLVGPLIPSSFPLCQPVSLFLPFTTECVHLPSSKPDTITYYLYEGL